MDRVEALERELEELRVQLADATLALAAVARGEVDAVAHEAVATPILLEAAQEDLRKNRALLRAVFDSSLDALLLADDRGVYVDANPAACALFGLERDALVGRSAIDFAEPNAYAPALYREFLASGRMRGHVPIRRPDGTRLVVEYSAAAHVVPGLHLSSLRDVTAENAARESLARSEARFRALIEKSTEGISIIDADGTVRFVSASAGRILGLSPEAVIGRNLGEFIHPLDRAFVVSEHIRLIAGARENLIQFRVVRPDGAVRWIEAAGRDMLDDPDVRGTVGNFRDITERKEAELALRSAQQLLASAERIAMVGSWAAGATPHAPIAWSEECARIFGRDHATAPSALEFAQMAHPDDRAIIIAASERAALEGIPCETEHRIVRPTGEVRWVQAKAIVDADLRWVGEAMTVGDGAPFHAVGVVRDITEQRVLEEERDGFFRLSLDLLSIAGVDGRFRRLNPAWEQTLGWTLDELCARPWVDFVHPDDRLDTLRVGEHVRGGGAAVRFENRFRCKSGAFRRLQWSSIASPESGLIYSCVRDVTEAVAAAERDRLLFAASPVPMWLVDLETLRFLEVNDAALAQSGYERDAFMSMSIRDVVVGAHHIRSDEWFRDLDAVGVPHVVERQHRVAGGGIRDVEVVRYRLDLAGRPAVLSVVTDITERKRSELALRRSEEQLRHAQKMEAVGSLAGGIAHDFNNLLSVILTYTKLIIDDLQAADPMRLDLEEVLRAGLRATDLTRQLLAFSRKQILQPSVLDLNAVLLGIDKMLRRMLGEEIELTLMTAQDAGKVFADQGQIEQVIMNLAVNARDAMPAGGNLTIETASVVLDDHDAVQHPRVAPGPYVLLAVTDTGTGMSPEIQERIFEPFFTTKEQGKGTGLGLSTVYGIIQQSGGIITVHSAPDRGTRFDIYLPRTERIEVAVEPHPGRGESLRGTETVLLVEDETPVRNSIRSVLRRHGYHVLEAQNGGEAFLLCEQFSGPIHTLITDVVMPRMSGRQLAERLARLRPEMKVLFVSGYTEDTIAHHGILDEGVEFLAKPVMPSALLEKVRQVLDARPRRVGPLTR